MPYPPSGVEEFELYEDVADGCARLKAANFLLVVITNQPDVGRGTQTREVVEAMNLKMQSALPLLDRVEICYHGGQRYGQPCGCRKPRPGLIHRAVAELNIDPKRSYVIGDRWRGRLRAPQVVTRFSSSAVTKKPCAKRLILPSRISTMQ
jgi:D-glycero-D-manno-heptose 1,7-bisphosphate phosphatase